MKNEHPLREASAAQVARAATPRRGRRGPVKFVGMGLLGGAFAGCLSHLQTPDALTTAVAVVLTFAGTVLALNLLNLALWVAMKAAKVAAVLGVLLAIGCVYDWPWAEAAVDWLLTAGARGAGVVWDQLVQWRAR